MAKIKVKICGLTNLSDARTALVAGADYLGFIFAPGSKRRVTPQAAARIIASLPATVNTVGVFVNSSVDEINSITALCRLNIVQLHGDESENMLFRLQGMQAIWKTVWLRNAADIKSAAEFPSDALVVDTAVAGKRGGTGVVGDWSLAARLARRAAVVLAGGLTPDNVEEAVRRVCPFAVDVAGGVEEAPGRKSSEKIHRFCRAVNLA